MTKSWTAAWPAANCEAPEQSGLLPLPAVVSVCDTFRCYLQLSALLWTRLQKTEPVSMSPKLQNACILLNHRLLCGLRSVSNDAHSHKKTGG